MLAPAGLPAPDGTTLVMMGWMMDEYSDIVGTTRRA